MVIDFGKAKVFKGLLPQSGQNPGLEQFSSGMRYSRRSLNKESKSVRYGET